MSELLRHWQYEEPQRHMAGFRDFVFWITDRRQRKTGCVIDVEKNAWLV